MRSISVSMRPSASWVADFGMWRSPSEAGICSGVTSGAGICSSMPRSRSAEARQSRPSIESSGKRSHSLPEGTPSVSWSSAICSSVRSAEWFIGCPAIGRPQPLMV